MSVPAEQLEVGYERDRLGSAGLMIRWWFFAYVPDARGRPQRPRLGVPGNGFRFARGGRVETESEAEAAIAGAQAEAQRELVFWRGQPSHALGVRGELIPLGAPELPA